MQSRTWTITASAPRHATAPTSDRLLTIGEVAETCRLSEKAIRRAIERGQPKAFKLCSRIRISDNDMRDWIASQRQPAGTFARPRTPATASRRPPQRHKRATPATGGFRALIPGNDHPEQAA